MLDWLTSKNWTVHISPGQISVNRGTEWGVFDTVRGAFIACGGSLQDCAVSR